jgi:hypothetical protein
MVAMQYMLAIYGDEREAESTPREQMTEIINAYMAYTKAVQDWDRECRRISPP